MESHFGRGPFKRTGSFGNGISVANFSDVDYIAVLPDHNVTQDSERMLKQVRHVLHRRFPRTDVQRSCPAVLIPFGQRKEEDTEVVPARYIGQRNGKLHVFAIPNCSGGWMPKSPETQNAYVTRIHQARGQKVKLLIRFIKAWGYARQVPISSFYIELFVARYAADQHDIVYGADVVGVFNEMERSGLAPVSDPTGVSGKVPACGSKSNIKTACSRVRKTASEAR